MEPEVINGVLLESVPALTFRQQLILSAIAGRADLRYDHHEICVLAENAVVMADKIIELMEEP